MNGLFPSTAPRWLLEMAGIGIALIASAVLVYWAAGDATVSLAYLGGLAVLALTAGLAATRARAPEPVLEDQAPDWSVTAAAIERPDQAIAITDRANRLVCANGSYATWFGSDHAPARLPLNGDHAAAMLRAARAAWRDQTSEDMGIACDGREYRVTAARCGRGDSYLVWRFIPVLHEDPLANAHRHITGPFGRVLSSAGIEVALVGPDGAIRAVNAGFARRACGDAAASMVGQDFASLLRSDDRDRIYFGREGRKGSPQTLVGIPMADPEVLAALGDEAPGKAAQPHMLMLLLDAGVGLGGWGGQEAPGQLPQLEALLEQLPLGLAMADRDGHFLFANPAFRRAAGIETRDMPPYPSDLVIRQDKGAMADAVRRYGQGPASSGDIAVRLRNEPDEPISIGLAGVRGMGDAAVLLSLADSTEETRLKRQVAQATKMQAVGQLAGGVAHDFNNVLTAIIGYCDLMLLRHTPGDSDYDDIQQIKANSNRAASLTRQLLAFSRQQTLQPEVLQLPDVLAEVSQLLKRLLGAKITLKTHHDRDLGPVRADPRQLEQVIVNLAVNARDAINARSSERSGEDRGSGEGQGTLTFSTRRIAARDIRRMGTEIIPAGDYTALIAEDTGGGVPTEVLPKIFEPFFTTKELGKGTGLGLSTVYGIVKQSGGFIFADNALNPDGTPRGARFTIYLPVYHATEEELRRVEITEEESEWSGGGRILLVEDEDMVRAVAERALARQGYTVVTARDGDEGVEAVRSQPEFDLVVSDVVMPSMDGPAMAREIRQIAPDLPVLFMSGYAEEQLRREIDMEAMHFIAKPFSVAQIAAKVGEVLRLQRR
jgi:two-component system cell cycle sensor histidine kinase/response regulator CckA